MKRMIKKHISVLLAAFIFFQNIHAQDLHFSQYFNSPLLVNPANTGFMPDYDYRIGGNYRNQWASVGNPYKTMSLWGDTKLFGERMENGWLGVGGALLNDVAGTGSLTSFKAFASVAYHQVISDNSLLSIGFQAGFANKRVDVNKLTFDDQWNGKFFDAGIPTNEPIKYSSISYVDFNAGINYAYFATDNAYFNLGVSMQHINRPQESFYDASVVDNRLDYRYTLFFNSLIKVQDMWIVNPNLYVSKVNTAYETVIGVNANRSLSEGGTNQLILGLYYRLGDAAIPVIGYQVNDLKITFNYDATVSSLGSYNATRGAYEISIIKNGIINKGSKALKQLRCRAPSFSY